MGASSDRFVIGQTNMFLGEVCLFLFFVERE